MTGTEEGSVDAAEEAGMPVDMQEVDEEMQDIFDAIAAVAGPGLVAAAAAMSDDARPHLLLTAVREIEGRPRQITVSILLDDVEEESEEGEDTASGGSPRCDAHRVAAGRLAERESPDASQ